MEKDSKQSLFDLFMQAPAAIAVLRGKDHVFVFANPLYLELASKTEKIYSQTVRDAFPELNGQGFYEILDKVYKTGKPFVGKELPADLVNSASGQLERKYVNIVYQPLKGTDKKVNGIMMHAIEVTKEVKTRIQSQKDEERYRTLFNSIDQGFCIIEVLFDDKGIPQDYIFIEVNKVFEMQTGLKNVVSKRGREAIPGLEDRWIEIYGQVALTRKAVRFTESSDVMGRWFEVYAMPIDTPETHRVAILFSDISERKVAELALIKSEVRHRTIIENLEEGVAVLNAEGVIVSANQSAEKLLGLTIKQLQGRTSLDPRWRSVHEDGTAMPGSEHAPQQVLRTKKAYKNQTMGIHKPNGDLTWLTVNAQPMMDGDELTGVVVSFFDITNSNKIKEALEQQLQVTKTITEIASSCLFLIDSHGIVTYMNPAATRVTGYSATEAIGQPMHVLVHHSHPDGRPYPEAECPLVHTYRDGLLSPLHEDVFYRKDGTTFPALITGTPIPEKNGVRSTVVEFRDIKEIKNALRRNDELEEATLLLKEQRSQLVALNNAKDDFIAIASHQLRTPATAVKQYLGLVLQGFTEPLTVSQAKFIGTANDSNERQLIVINDLLRTAKIDSSRYTIKQELVSIPDIIDEAIADMQPALDIKRQRVEHHKPKVSCLAMVDKAEMKLVFINLLENSCKYSYPDSLISITVKKVKSQVVIQISDNGVGISNSNISKIFDKFTRIDNDLSDTVSGTGLGLYWVKKIIKLHNGNIKVVSKLGSGSTFTVSLPS